MVPEERSAGDPVEPEPETETAEEESPAVDPDFQRAIEVAKWAPRSRFFHVVSMLERMMPDRARVGGDGPPSDEGLRIRHDPSLGFSAGDISSVVPIQIAADPTRPLSPQHEAFQLTSTFLGLTGSVSPLPLYIPEEVALEDSDKSVRRDFLDLFHHRILSLLYRSVTRYSPAREHVSEGPDPWLQRSLALAGMDSYHGPVSQDLPNTFFLRLLPMLLQRSRTGHGLSIALRRALAGSIGPEVNLDIRQFVGRRVAVDDGQKTALGKRNHVLGKTSLLGGRSFDRASRFSIRIGPLGADNFAGFMEGGESLRTIQRVVEVFCRRPLDFDVELDLASDAVPRFQLSAKDPQKLGRGTWLRGHKAAQIHVVRDAMEPSARTANR